MGHPLWQTASISRGRTFEEHAAKHKLVKHFMGDLSDCAKVDILISAELTILKMELIFNVLEA